MTTTLLRRLPGFEFESRIPVADELPRMDVAVFAGFAARGPVHVPVPVEDPAAFEAIFGADAPLAWDAETGEDVYAQLGPAVRMFFANGGRRCWIIRLAAEAESNRFPVPGMVSGSPGMSGPRQAALPPTGLGLRMGSIFMRLSLATAGSPGIR